MIDTETNEKRGSDSSRVRLHRGVRVGLHGPHARMILYGALGVLLLVGVIGIRWRASATNAATTVSANVAERDGSVGALSGGDSTIALDSTAQRLAGVELFTVLASNAGSLTANGTITYDANRVSVVSSRVEGRLAAVRADLGQQVTTGTVLAIIESFDVGQTRGELERARVNVEVARANFERETRLFAEQITPQKELLDAEGTYRAAQADYDAAIAKLRAVGASSGAGATFGLSTPVSGTVVERNASPGQVVGPSSNLFTVADLRHVWITVDVYEGDVARVQRGAAATVNATALPGRSFTGKVSYAGGVVDSASHTFKVRVDVANEARDLRPGMFAQVRIVTAGMPPDSGDHDATPSIIVPEIAVQEVNGKSVVFVSRETLGVFVARPVTVGARTGGGNVLVTGLAVGERIAVRGAFQLKAELTKASFTESD